MLQTARTIGTGSGVILLVPVPLQEGLPDRHLSSGGRSIQQHLHFHTVKAIHAGREVMFAILQRAYECGLWRKKQHMSIRTLELRKLRHAYGHLRQTGRGLAQQSIRSQPRRSRISLHILPKTDVHRIVIFGYVSIDVIQSAVPNLNINFALEYALQKSHERRHEYFASAS